MKTIIHNIELFFLKIKLRRLISINDNPIQYSIYRKKEVKENTKKLLGLLIQFYEKGELDGVMHLSYKCMVYKNPKAFKLIITR